MKKKIFITLTVLATTLFGSSMLPAPSAYAACPSSDSSKGKVLDGIGETGGNCDDSGVGNFINVVVNIISYIAGIAAIIMIILSGFKYITSGGDSGKISSAKTTLIYALVGVAVVVLSQLLVRFVITQADSAAKAQGCSVGHHRSADGKKCLPDRRPT